MNRSIQTGLCLAVLAGCLQCTPKDTSAGKPSAGVCGEAGVQKEFLNRGVVALTRADSSVYIGWRLLEDDPSDVAFNVYRKMLGAVAPNDYVKVNKEPIIHSTNYVDKADRYGFGKTAKEGEAFRYKVTRIVDGKEEDTQGGEAFIFLSPVDQPWYSVFMQDLNTGIHKMGIGDLDGDGAFDFVVIRNSAVYVDPYFFPDCWVPSRDTYKMDAYTSKGKFLWRYDMGWAIETGLWYAPFMVYDVDGDGKAEVYAKAGEGDPREEDGHVLGGPEYLVKIDGQTGKILQKRNWISKEGFGVESYNYSSRNFMGLAYLDGRKPSLLMERGTYSLIKMEAVDKDLKTEWTWESSGEYRDYSGQGGHNIRVADINEDGKDELIPGNFALDGNGKPLWRLGLGHNDGSAVADIDPDRPGLEIFFNIESAAPKNGLCLVDAATGEYIWGYDKPTMHVHDQGMTADIDPNHPGMESYAVDSEDFQPFMYSAKGERLSDKFMGTFSPNALWWDADELKEVQIKENVFKFGGDTIVKIEGEVLFVGDIIGDWREEIVTSLPGEIRIYSTTIPANNRKVCLMQDHQYRMETASASVGYNTPPQLGLAKDAKHKYSK